jgi:hypothetical protein
LNRDELASLISRLDGMLAATLSNTWRRTSSGNDGDKYSQAAYEQYWLFLKLACHSLACALLICALEPTLKGVRGLPVSWCAVARAALDRLERFKTSLPPRSAEIRGLLESVCACVSNGWNMMVLPGAAGSICADNRSVAEGDAMRMIRLRALLASGVHSRHVLNFCRSEGNQGLMRSPEVQELLLTDGMIEETCDAMIVMAPTKASYNDGSIQQKRFDEIMARVWAYDTGAGVRFGLRSALLDVLPFKPDFNAFNPIATGRSWILQSTVAGLLQWADNTTVLQWQQTYCKKRPEYVPEGQNVSLAEIRRRVAQLLDKAEVRFAAPFLSCVWVYMHIRVDLWASV